MTTEAAAIVAALAPHIPIPLGSLCVWGDWFGKPRDNQHILVGIRVDENVLELTFGEDEVLRVTSPRDWRVEPVGGPETPVLRIGRADRVEWEWNSYGHARLPESRHRWIHWREAGEVHAMSERPDRFATFAPSVDEPAVIFL